MREAVIVEALRSPIARGKLGRGELSAFHPAQLLGKLQDAVVEKAGIDPIHKARNQARHIWHFGNCPAASPPSSPGG